MTTVKIILSVGLVMIGCVEMVGGYWLDPRNRDSHLIRAILMFVLADLVTR